MQIELTQARVRPLRASDAKSLAHHANHPNIAAQLRDAFPYPYSEQDARDFLERVFQAEPATVFAIEVDELCVGTVGWKPRTDVERVCVEIGYWLGVSFAGRGIVTEAVREVTKVLLSKPQIFRVEARVFERNRASSRVLEKAGFRLEAVMPQSAIKEGVLLDQELWAICKNEIV